MKNLIISGDLEVLVQTIDDIYHFSTSSTTKNKKSLNLPKNSNLSSPNKQLKSPTKQNILPSDIFNNNSNTESIVLLLTDLLLQTLQCDIKYAKELVLSASISTIQSINESQSQTYKRWINYFTHGYTSINSKYVFNQTPNYDPLMLFFREVYTSSNKIASICSDSTDALLLMLRFFQPGLISLHFELSSWVSRCFSRIVYELDGKSKEDCYNWFIGSSYSSIISPRNPSPDLSNGNIIGTGLHSFILCFNRYNDLKLSLFSMLDNICRNHYYHFYTQAITLELLTPASLLGFIHELLPMIHSQIPVQQSLISDGIIEYWLDQSCKYAENASGTSRAVSEVSDETVSQSLSLLTQLWIDFPSQVESRSEVTQQMLALLRKGVRHASKAVNIATIVSLFSALEAFTNEKNRFSPFIYKILVFALVEHYPNEFLRHFISANFCQCLLSLNNIPVHVIIDPLLKQMSLHGFSNLDFDLLLVIAKHPRLPLKHGMLLAHQLGKLALQDLVLGRCASIPFLVLINRYLQDESMIRYCEKYVKVDLSLFMKSFEDEKNEAVQLLDQENSSHNQRRTLALELIAKLVHLRNQQLIELCVIPSLASVIAEFQNLYGFIHAGLQSVYAYIQQQLHLIDEEGGGNERPLTLRLDSNNVIVEIKSDSYNIADNKKQLDPKRADSKLKASPEILVQNKVNKSRQSVVDAKDIDVKNFRSELMPVQKRKAVTTNEISKDDDSIEGWPSIEVANVFRKEFGFNLKKLFYLYVGQKPALTKTKSFEDLEKMKSLLSIVEYLKLYTELQLMPSPLNKVDMGFIFATANQGNHSDMKAQVMALDEFYKSLYLVGQELHKRNMAPWINLLDPSISNSLVEQARCFILFLKQRCSDIEFAPLIGIWKKPKPKSYFSLAPGDDKVTSYLNTNEIEVNPASICSAQILHMILLNSLKISLVPSSTSPLKSNSGLDQRAIRHIKSKSELEEEKKKALADEKALTEKKAKELAEKLALQRIEKDKRESAKKELLAKQKEQEDALKAEKLEKMVIQREEKRLQIEEFRKKKAEEAIIEAEKQKAVAEADAAERKRKLDDWQKQKTLNPASTTPSPLEEEEKLKKSAPISKPKIPIPPIGARPSLSGKKDILAKDKPDVPSSNTKPAFVKPAPKKEIPIIKAPVAAKKDEKSINESVSKLIEKAPIKIPSKVPIKSSKDSKANKPATSRQQMVNSDGKPENWDVLAKADAKVNNASEEDLNSIKESALKDLESAQNAAIDLLKRVSSLKQNHDQVMDGPDASRPDSKLIANSEEQDKNVEDQVLEVGVEANKEFENNSDEVVVESDTLQLNTSGIGSSEPVAVNAELQSEPIAVSPVEPITENQ